MQKDTYLLNRERGWIKRPLSPEKPPKFRIRILLRDEYKNTLIRKFSVHLTIYAHSKKIKTFQMMMFNDCLS